jgi:hypothetical protein
MLNRQTCWHNHHTQRTPQLRDVCIQCRSCGAAGVDRSPTMRARRATLKSRRDDMIVAPGKRSAARGNGRTMIVAFFPSVLARQRRAKTEGKKEVGLGGVSPRAAASAALPGATFMPPRWGSGGANQALAPNRRPGFPLGSFGSFVYLVSAPPASRAAVGEAPR